MDKIKKVNLLIWLLVFPILKLNAQQIQLDSIKIDKKSSLKYQSLIIPTIFIGYGVVGLENNGLKSLNEEIHQQIKNQNNQNLPLDNITQYAPALSVYGLNAVGIKGKNNFKDRTIILATASLLMTATTVGFKSLTKVERPDLSDDDSFPSGSYC
ncbi:MAG: hypothetical protein Q7U08_04200 [Flavobacteriaceae bacterium]|nr:hypothetical protein [Flavobacteriaceae bacterium]